MNNLKNHLDQAYMWLSKIPVTGEAVDHMAMARQELREAFRLAIEQREETKMANKTIGFEQEG